jgi:beta-galactosidase
MNNASASCRPGLIDAAMKFNLVTLVLVALLCSTALAADAKHTFTIGEDDFLLDGAKFQIRCGEVHAARVPAEYWRHRLKMAKAMGLNTVCAYLFWNMHEPMPGEFNWSGQADVAQFCKIAQEEGLWVILRPGPYACAEWEMGGLPWWLLKFDDIQLRTRDPRFVDAARRYLKEVGRVLGPLQITQGGPILMVQVENEYGSYGKDADYMGDMRQALLDGGFNVPLFACNPVQALRSGYRADLFPVVNFGSNPAGAFRALREILPKGPLMCGEFYPGWFDTWGNPHRTGNTQRYLTDLEYMLKAGASFSIYMAHGGTTFGLWSGADRPFRPDTSSYDYDAPISEAGYDTEKFTRTRELMSKYLLPGETLPEVPARNPAMSFPAVQTAQFAPVFANLPQPISDPSPRTFEQYDLSHGCILYRTTIPAGPAGALDAKEIHDYAFIYLDGQRIGTMDRRNRQFAISLPARSRQATLDILVEAVGRVNFGTEVHDRKGIHAPVRITAGETSSELTGWQVYKLPLDEKMLAGLKFSDTKAAGPGFWRFSVQIDKPADTWLDMHPWGKGVAWVNGHCLGRFWNIGPTQTMYVPGPWLKAGTNEIVIYDLLGPENPSIAGVDSPVLNELRPKLDFSRAVRRPVQVSLEGVTPAHSGEFAPGSQMQEVRLPDAVSGRYFAIESVSAFDGKPQAAMAELDLLDQSGAPINHNGWTVAYVDSEEREREDGTAENAINGQTIDYWISQWGSAQPAHPHRLILDLGQSRRIGGFRYVPRQGDDSVSGRIKSYRIYIGDNLVRQQ